jgi:Sulfate permease family
MSYLSLRGSVDTTPNGSWVIWLRVSQSECSLYLKYIILTQALAYAKLAGVPLQFGLYSSLVGLLFYFFFATSKDVTVGPTAVLSQV